MARSLIGRKHVGSHKKAMFLETQCTRRFGDGIDERCGKHGVTNIKQRLNVLFGDDQDVHVVLLVSVSCRGDEGEREVTLVQSLDRDAAVEDAEAKPVGVLPCDCSSGGHGLSIGAA